MEKKSEDRIQQECFMWFNNTYPHLRGCLFSVPNGGARSSQEGKLLKATGLWPGVSDLLFMLNGVTTCIEMKTPTGTQSTNQKIWAKQIRGVGFKYYIVRSTEEFKTIITNIITEL